MVIEDDRDIRESFEALLKSEGYRVKTACNGREALDLLHAIEAPCLIFVDLMMPVMNGWEFIEAAHKDHVIAPVPIVIVSAVANHARVDAARVQGVIKKPVDLEFMLRVVHKYCGSPP